jgi:type I restriction enzyme, S subunit
MSAVLTPYPDYRDSGVDWLGKVPTHWIVDRAKAQFREVDDRSVTGDEELLSISHKTGVTPRRFKNITMFQAESYAGYKLARPGDLVVNTMWAWMAALGVSQHDGIVSNAYGVYRPREGAEMDGRYYDRLLRIETYRAEYVRRSTGITTSRLRLYPPKLLAMPLIQPPPKEQRRIADFLDAYTAQVHRLIAAKRRLLKAVHEQNQLALHELLIRGVDRGAPVAPSGHPWLGDVPQGWEVAPLKQFAAVNPALGRALPGRTEEVTFLPMERIGVDATVDYSEHRPVQTVSSGFTSFAVGDVVLAKITPCFENGKSAWLNEMPTEIGFGTTELHVLRPTPRLRPELLLQWLRLDLFRQWGEVSMVGAAGQQRVPARFVRDFVVAVSPHAEQQGRMVAQALALNDEHRAVTERIKREIDLILEYRDSLIAAVVTGRLDVREAVIPVAECNDMSDDAATDDEDLEDALEQVD